ncbi:hypothetical protein ACS0TY_027861 [Phlomoides rotata]
MGFSESLPKTMNTSQKARKITKNNDFLMNFPPQIMLEILSWLPPKSIISCKCVCKKWLNLITDPYFVRLHCTRSKPGLVIYQSEMFKKYFKIVEFEDTGDHHNLAYDTMMKFRLNSLSPFPDANIVVDGSINGFLFLRDICYKHETLYVCNPLTREYIQLPTTKEIVRYPCIVTHGFGASLKSGEYKVVRIFHQRELHPVTRTFVRVPYSVSQVYTLGTGEWRSLGEAPFAYDSRSMGLFFKGNLHWLIQDLEGPELISCFDLEKETFQPFPPPFPGRKLQGSLGVLKDCLCLCDNTSTFDIEIWLMKEYGVEKSWTKEFVIEKIPKLAGLSFQIVHALRTFRDGSILFMWGDYCMFYYCGKKRVTEEVDMNQARGPNCIEAMDYVPSFVNLRSFVMEKVIMF